MLPVTYGSFGLKVGVAAALLIMAVATLSTLVSSSPGYVGRLILQLFLSFTMLGRDAAQAASFAILAHLSLWLLTTLAGSLAILTHPHLFKRARLNPAAEIVHDQTL